MAKSAKSAHNSTFFGSESFIPNSEASMPGNMAPQLDSRWLWAYGFEILRTLKNKYISQHLFGDFHQIILYTT
jgi:hypothetical protein